MEHFESLERNERHGLFTPEDITGIREVLETNGCQKVFVIGPMGAGKSTFAKELARQTNIPCIELDDYAALYEQERGERSNSIRETLDFALEKHQPPYIVEHAELLKGDTNKADLVVFLDPPQEELKRSFEERRAHGGTGDWKKFSPEMLVEFTQEVRGAFEVLPGRIVYENTGVTAKLVDQQ